MEEQMFHAGMAADGSGGYRMAFWQYVKQLLCGHDSLSSEWAEYHIGKTRINEKIFEQCNHCGKVLVDKRDKMGRRKP
jgi:hypothetical protein